MLRSADVAKMLPCVPAAMTATEATNTMKSAGGEARSRPASGSEVGAGGPGAVGGGWEDREGPQNLCQQPGSGSGCQPWGLGSGVKRGRAGLITDDTEGFSGKAEAALPSSVAAAASGRPDADDVLQAKHHDHHEFLRGQGPEFWSLSRSKGPGHTVLAQPGVLGLGVPGFPQTTWLDPRKIPEGTWPLPQTEGPSLSSTSCPPAVWGFLLLAQPSPCQLSQTP